MVDFLENLLCEIYCETSMFITNFGKICSIAVLIAFLMWSHKDLERSSNSTILFDQIFPFYKVLLQSEEYYVQDSVCFLLAGTGSGQHRACCSLPVPLLHCNALVRSIVRPGALVIKHDCSQYNIKHSLQGIAFSLILFSPRQSYTC